MKRKIFDVRLYRNGLSQLRLAGILFCILGVLAGGLPCLFEVLQIRQMEAAGSTVSYPAFQDTTVLLVGIMFLAPVALCLTLFSFLNHRSGSDFYHSIPQTRSCLFASFGTAALTWGWLAILLGVGAAAAVFGAAGIGGRINFAPLPYVLFTDLAGLTLLTAEMVLSMSITGTVVTNLTVFGLVLFLPRFLTNVFAQMLVGRLRFIDSTAFGLLGDTTSNIPVGFFLSAFRGSFQKLYSSVGPIWYTFALAAVYLVLAGVLFTRRRSESAARSAPNRPLQHIYRCLIALPPSLIIPYLAVSWDSSNGSFLFYNLNSVIVVTVITLLVYFLFELISTKSPRNLLRAAPIFLAVVAFDVIFGFSAKGAEFWFLHDTPGASQIRSVTFQYVDSSSSGQTPTYNRLMIRRAALTDSRLTAQVAQALSETTRRIEDQDYDSSFEYYVDIRLKSGRVLTRKLYATQAETQTIESIKSADTQFHTAQTGLPPDGSIKQITLNGLDANSVGKIWDTFRSEYGALTDTQKMQLVGTTSSHAEKATDRTDDTETSDPLATLVVQGSAGLDNYQSEYSISNLTPKTQAAYIRLSNQKNFSLLWSRVKRIADGDKVSYGYAVNGHNLTALPGSNTQAYTLAYGSVTKREMQASGTSETDRQVMQILLSHRGDTTVDLSKPYGELSIYSFDGMTGYDQSRTIFCNLTGDEIQKIISLQRGAKGNPIGNSSAAQTVAG